MGVTIKLLIKTGGSKQGATFIEPGEGVAMGKWIGCLTRSVGYSR